MLIGAVLTLWILSGLFGYLYSMSRFSRRIIDLGRIEWHLNLEIYGSPNTWLSRSLGRLLEIVRFCLCIMFGPLSIFWAFMSRLDDDEYYDPPPKSKVYNNEPDDYIWWGSRSAKGNGDMPITNSNTTRVLSICNQSPCSWTNREPRAEMRGVLFMLIQPCPRGSVNIFSVINDEDGSGWFFNCINYAKISDTNF